VIILFAGSFVLITKMKQQSKDLSGKYATGNCTVLESLYNSDEMLHYAMDNYQDYYYPESGKAPLTQLPAQFSCFCADQYTQLGINVIETNYTYGGKTAPICYDYVEDSYTITAA
jgi:hypothetical protein